MKITIFCTSKPTREMANAIEKYGEEYEVPLTCHAIRPNQNMTFDLNQDDLWHITTSDAIVIFGTWGSTSKRRQYFPGTTERQAKLEFLNQFVVNMANSYNKKLIVVESSTLSRIRSNYAEPLSDYKDNNRHKAKEYSPKFYRMGLKHWTYGRADWVHPTTVGVKRLERFKKDFRLHYNGEVNFETHKWNYDPDGLVAIFPGLEHDPTSTIPVDIWLEDLLKVLPSYTKKRIAVKPHPLSALNYKERYKDYDFVLLGQYENIQDMKDRLYCAVLDSSTSVFELLDLGIPCVTSKTNFGAPFGNTDLKKIDKLTLKDEKFYHQWCVEMAHTEFRLEEYACPQIFPYIMNLLR